jgi:hypothetical protein
LAFNGSGTHVRVHDWTTDKANVVAVTASRMDAEHDDISTALTNTICRDGQSTTTARIPFAAGVSAMSGATTGVSFSNANDANTGLYFPSTDQWGLVAGGTATLTSTATNLTAGVALGGADGTVSLPGYSFSADLDCGMYRIGANNIGVAVNGAKVLDVGTAGLAVTGTLSSTGAATLSSTLAVTGNVAVNTDKFTVTAASGNTLVAGTLAVTGAATLSSTLAVTGNVAVNTDKFTVTAASGNTLVAGTLAVTGASTLTGALAANNSAGVTARNTAKAFGKVVNGTLQAGSLNVASITDNGSSHTVTFTAAMANTNYAIMLAPDGDNIPNTAFILRYHTVAEGSFRVEANIPGVSGNQDPDSYSFIVFSNE